MLLNNAQYSFVNVRLQMLTDSLGCSGTQYCCTAVHLNVHHKSNYDPVRVLDVRYVSFPLQYFHLLHHHYDISHIICVICLTIVVVCVSQVDIDFFRCGLG